MIAKPDISLMMYMVATLVALFGIVAGIIFLVVYLVRKNNRKMSNPNPQNFRSNSNNQYQSQQHYTNYDTNMHHAGAFVAADAFNHQQHFTDSENTFGDKDHDGIPDQFDNYDNRFDTNINNDSTSSFDNNSSGGDSSSGSSDSSNNSTTTSDF